MIKDRLCSCGVPASQCDRWSIIFREAFSDLDYIDAQHMVDAGHYAASKYRIFDLLKPTGRERLLEEMGSYLDNYERLYHAIHLTTGASVIVDTSKRSLVLYLLGRNSSIDFRIVHLIRDSRAVAYSWLHKKTQQLVDGEPLYMQQFRPGHTAIRWLIRNLLVELVSHLHVPTYSQVRYEKFVGQPQETISRILNLVNKRPSTTPFVAPQTVRIAGTHTVRGNPVRFRTGNVKLELDDEWMNQMSRLEMTCVTILSWPLLLRYGYLINTAH